MILYFLRHGDAGEPRQRDDDARELTDKGEDALRDAAHVWRRLGLQPEVVITSPLPRARRTAELLVQGLELGEPPRVDPGLQPGAGWDDFSRAMAAYPDARRVMFVGHDPDLSRAVALLTGAHAIRLRKGGMACVEFRGTPVPGGGELAWLLDPDLYAREADAVG